MADKTLPVAAVPTQFNSSDMGTKSLQQRRLKMLCFLAGMVDEALGREVLGHSGGDLRCKP